MRGKSYSLISNLLPSFSLINSNIYIYMPSPIIHMCTSTPSSSSSSSYSSSSSSLLPLPLLLPLFFPSLLHYYPWSYQPSPSWQTTPRCCSACARARGFHLRCAALLLKVVGMQEKWGRSGEGVEEGEGVRKKKKNKKKKKKRKEWMCTYE